MAKATDAINRVILIEGGFVNNPADKGGPTKYGITQAVYDKFIGRKSTIDEIKNMPIGNAVAIYKTNYWDKIRGDEIKSYAVAYSIFDQAVNWGLGKAIKRTQRVLNEPETGTLTNSQLALLNSIDEQAFIDSYLEFARQAYLLTVASNPAYEQFKKGWLNRVEKIRTYVYSKFQQALVNVAVTAKENAMPIGIISLVLIGGIAYYLYNKKESKPRLLAEGM